MQLSMLLSVITCSAGLHMRMRCANVTRAHVLPILRHTNQLFLFDARRVYSPRRTRSMPRRGNRRPQPSPGDRLFMWPYNGL